MKKIGIIGFGRFGKLLNVIFSTYFSNYMVKIYSKEDKIDEKNFYSLDEVAKCDFIFPCVPISEFENVILEIKNIIPSTSILIDVCSVKVHPKDVISKYIPNTKSVLTHPMFGPSTYKKLNNNLSGLNLVIQNNNLEEKDYKSIIRMFKKLELNIIEMDAEEHDRLAAKFHFVTQVIAGTLNKMQIPRSKIDTKSASVMLDFVEMVGTDEKLLLDMYKYNPYCKLELDLLKNSFNSVINIFNN